VRLAGASVLDKTVERMCSKTVAVGNSDTLKPPGCFDRHVAWPRGGASALLMSAFRAKRN
jgi:hypothetical protein